MRLYDHPGSLSDVQGIHHYNKVVFHEHSTGFVVVDFMYVTRKPVLRFYPVAICLGKYDGKMYDVQLFRSRLAFTTFARFS